MPITPFLNGERFDAETRRILGVALEMSCIALRVGHCADDVRQAIANKGINEQIFRQNELLIQYQELMVTLAYMPAIPAPHAAANKGGGAPQAPQPAKPQAPPSKP